MAHARCSGSEARGAAAPLRAALAFLELQEAGDVIDVADSWGELASAHEQMLELEQRATFAQNQASPLPPGPGADSPRT